ncbi:uL15 family ribosomal protein [Candidatus Woesearchaeota archaeon]|nr:uL15 family ribosomal protein [Candidatus Woesearchaeota archaeon]
MTANRRKKSSRHRGSHTHGWGSMKKHRGAGHHGGAGMAGTGKRADSKKPSVWKLDYFGRRGFSPPGARDVRAVNISYIEEHLPFFVGKGAAVEESGKYLIDLGKAGYSKLLGKGRLRSKMVIKVKSASRSAVESVKESGGEVQLV